MHRKHSLAMGAVDDTESSSGFSKSPLGDGQELGQPQASDSLHETAFLCKEKQAVSYLVSRCADRTN